MFEGEGKRYNQKTENGRETRILGKEAKQENDVMNAQNEKERQTQYNKTREGKCETNTIKWRY